MLLVAALVVAVVTVPPAGGRLSALADLTIRRAWALGIALGLQVALVYVWPEGSPGLLAAVHVASYVAAGWFVIANSHIPGWWLVGLGGLMNFAAIAANTGVMPASRGAVAAAGLSDVPRRFANSAVVTEPRLAWLGDIFAVPAGWPLANVFSVGDVCLAAGAAVALHGVCRSRLSASGAGEFTGLFAHRPFVAVWVADAGSGLGQWAYVLAIVPVLVSRAGAAHALAALVIVQAGSGALAGLLGGALVDRLTPLRSRRAGPALLRSRRAGPALLRSRPAGPASRRRLMVALALVRGASVATLVAPAEPSLVHLHAVAASLGLCGALWQVGVAASIPDLVPRRRVVAANGLVWSTAAMALAAGPTLGGKLVSTLGAETAIAVVAAGFATSAAVVARSRLGMGAESSGGLQDVAEAARYAGPSALLRGALVAAGVLLFATTGRWSHPLLYVVDGAAAARQAAVLLGGAAIFGFVLGAAGAPALARRWSRDRLLPYGLAAAGALVAASQWAAPASRAGLWILAGAAAGLVLMCYQSLLQEQTPDFVRGRVLGVATAVLHSAALGGVALEAWIAGLVGTGALAASTGLLFVAALASVALVGVPRPTPLRVQGGRIAPSAS